MGTKNPAPISYLADTALRRGLDKPQASFSELEKTFSFTPEQIQQLRGLMKCLNLSEKTILNMAIVYELKFRAIVEMQVLNDVVNHLEKNFVSHRADTKMTEITSEITLTTKNLVEAKQMQPLYNSLAASGLTRLHVNLNIDQIKDIA